MAHHPETVNGWGAPFDNAPPHNFVAEQAVLGALMVWNDAIEDVEPLAPQHFFDPFHASIFEAIVRAVRVGRQANPITLRPDCESAEPISRDVSAVQYLGILAAQAATRQSLKDYVRQIIDLSVRRRLILAGEDLALAARGSSLDIDPGTLIEETEAHLLTLADQGGARAEPSKSMVQASSEAFASVLRAARGERAGLKTGFGDLDKKLGGLHPTDLIILAGRPSMGKTALATNIALNVANRGTHVDFYSLEMSAEQLAMRVIGERARLPAQRLRDGDLDEFWLREVEEVARQAGDIPISIDETGGISIAQLTARARRKRRRNGTGLVIVDYLQLMQASARRRENRVQDITEITIGLKALAKELRVPVIALSQLSRKVEERPDKRPQLADLRESGSIEQDADVVMFVFREEYYVEREEPSQHAQEYEAWQRRVAACAGKAEVIIGKQRHGPTGTVQLAFNGTLTRFSSLARDGAAS